MHGSCPAFIFTRFIFVASNTRKFISGTIIALSAYAALVNELLGLKQYRIQQTTLIFEIKFDHKPATLLNTQLYHFLQFKINERFNWNVYGIQCLAYVAPSYPL